MIQQKQKCEKVEDTSDFSHIMKKKHNDIYANHSFINITTPSKSLIYIHWVYSTFDIIATKMMIGNMIFLVLAISSYCQASSHFRVHKMILGPIKAGISRQHANMLDISGGAKGMHYNHFEILM